MFDYNAIKQQVLDYIEPHEKDFDVDQIMDDLRFVSRNWNTDVASIVDFDSDEFLWIVKCNEVEGL